MSDGHGTTVRELVNLCHKVSASELGLRFGALALVGAPTDASTSPGFRYATEHTKREAAPHPMASLLESVVFGLFKRSGAAFASVVVIGRAPNSDVWIDHPSISKLHARVTIDEGGRHHVSDAGSANGTFVDDAPLAGRDERVLVEGSRLRLGDRAFTVRAVPTLHAMLRRFPKP